MRFRFAVVVFGLLLLGVSWASESPKFAPTHLVIETSGAGRVGRVCFSGELASTDRQLAYGLKFRDSIAEDYAMLFDLGEVRRAAFWMQDTYIALDMLFVRADGSIANIIAEVPPLTLAPRKSNGEVRAVIELKAGTAKKHNIRVGDRVRHALFSREAIPDCY